MFGKYARALFVAADGEISPCVYANLPVAQGVCVRQGHMCRTGA
jgi:hypothetical protein